MPISAAIITVSYLIAMTALLAWFVRRQAKARATYRRRAAIIAQIREDIDKEGPIVGWMVRDVPAPVKPGRRVRDLY
jgi:hypothetical protein